jgi:protease I
MTKILIVIPHEGFRDEEYEALTGSLESAGHEVSIGSSHHSDAQGHFGLLVKPDINIGFVEPSDYDALIFIGGRGIEEYVNDSSAINLIRNFFYENKVIGALGHAVEVLIYAGILSGRRVTTDIGTIPKVQGAGAYYTGTLVSSDGKIITGTGSEAKEEFAKVIVDALKLEKRGEAYARIT